MELRQFRYFVAVAEELHFSRAAQRLHIGQPPLSLQIQAIERELGVLLLKRDRRKVELTEAGQLFLDQARSALAQAQRAIETAKRAARGEVGTLRLSFTTSAPLVDVFTRSVRAFREACPDIHLELKIKTSQRILDQLLLNNIDLGLVRPAIHTLLPRGIEAVPVARDRLMLVVPSNHPLALDNAPVPMERLADENFILRPRGSGAGFYEQVFALCTEAGFSPRITQEAEEATTTLGLVAAGLGITIAPAALQAIRVSDIAWLDLDVGDRADSAIMLVYNAKTQNRLRDTFIERVVA